MTAFEIDIVERPDPAVLEPEWRGLEPCVPSLSFFQSWTWVGCLAEERFRDSVLVRARTDQGTAGLALFGRRGRTLFLHESGTPVLDAPFIEHNRPLGEAAAAEAILAAAWRVRGISRVVLSGFPHETCRVASPHRLRERMVAAPFVDLATIRASGNNYLDTRSANTRLQIRRSLRRYASRGPVLLARAEGEEEALHWFREMAALHTETWLRRGRGGAFSDSFSRRFHEALIRSAIGRAEVDLLRLTAGDSVLGYLYNLRLGGRLYAYQSGLAYATATNQEKPGLSMHALAIERALAAGDTSYDFLAGPDRYKLSLATDSVSLAWLELAPPTMVGRLVAAGWTALRRLRRG